MTPFSVTGQVAGGAQIVVFTTGRGSAFGSKPAPTIKLATNERLFAAMRDDMDINCGDIVGGGVSIAGQGRGDSSRRFWPFASGKSLPAARRWVLAITRSCRGRSERSCNEWTRTVAVRLPPPEQAGLPYPHQGFEKPVRRFSAPRGRRARWLKRSVRPRSLFCGGFPLSDRLYERAHEVAQGPEAELTSYSAPVPKPPGSPAGGSTRRRLPRRRNVRACLAALLSVMEPVGSGGKLRDVSHFHLQCVCNASVAEGQIRGLGA